MLFSKSFGYAVRGILYIVLMQDEKKYVQVDEIAEKLGVPRHFMGKVLKNLVKEGVLSSNKGPAGGFTVNEKTKSLPLFRLIDITEGLSTFKSCVLRVKECNAQNPCPLHGEIEVIKQKLEHLLKTTAVADLIGGDKINFINSISTTIGEPVLELPAEKIMK